MPYAKFGKKIVFVLPDFDVAFKVYIKSSIITRYFLTKIGHLLDVEVTLKVEHKIHLQRITFIRRVVILTCAPYAE